MLFEKLLFPSEMRSSYEDLTPEYLHSIGKKYIVSDIDNTLVTYDDEKPTERLLRWLRMMDRGGVTVAFISNNSKERVDLFNNELGYIAYSKAGKPKTGKIYEAIREMGGNPESTLFLGDQLLTDALCANRAGIYSVIVPPIRDKRNLFFRAKRFIERPYVRKFLNNKEKYKEWKNIVKKGSDVL